MNTRKHVSAYVSTDPRDERKYTHFRGTPRKVHAALTDYYRAVGHIPGGCGVTVWGYSVVEGEKGRLSDIADMVEEMDIDRQFKRR